MKKYYNKIEQGEFNPNVKANKIGGYKSQGNWIIGDGHHRVAAAIAYGMKTGNYTILEALIKNGAWTFYNNHINIFNFPSVWK